MFFEDGTPSHWTPEVIKEVEDKCSSDAQIQVRVHGRFLIAEGRKFSSFEATEHVKDLPPVPRDWLWYGGIDSGSGGDKGDPAAVVHVAVSPNYRKGRVSVCWRGDKITTTSSDIVMKHLELRGNHRMEKTAYDWSDKDLHTIAERMGIGFERADKAIDRGEGIVNALFKNGMLTIDPVGENLKLVHELSSVVTGKKVQTDHLCDALRYALMAVPWDWTVLNNEEAIDYVKPEHIPTEIELRRGESEAREPDAWAEFEELNDYYG
jgi:hypothetical protein